MNLTMIISVLTGLLLVGCSYGQKNADTVPPQKGNMETFEYSLESAHPNAKVLMTDDFFWSPIEEAGPFGSDDGWEAAQGFKRWRSENKSENPVTYLIELIEYWGYPKFDWNEMDSAKIMEYVNTDTNPDLDEETIRQKVQQLKQAMSNSEGLKGSKPDDRKLREIVIRNSKTMGGRNLLGQDNAIIGTGFAQFALEGFVDEDLKQLTITAIKRQLLPILINRYHPEHQPKRKQQLMKMLEVIGKANAKPSSRV